MGQLTKDTVVRYIVDRKKIWDIDKTLANQAVQNFNDGEFEKFSTMHYNCIYLIIKSKLAEIEDPAQRIAYIDCLIMNYNDMQDNKGINIITGIFSEGLLGVSLFDISNDTWIKVVAMLLIGVFTTFNIVTALTRRWKFYQMILTQVKSEMANS